MGDDGAAAGGGAVVPRQGTGDVLVGQAVEAVAAQPLPGVGQRQAIELVARGNRAVKGGVEAGDLGNRRRPFGQGADAGEVVRLVRSEERRVGNEGSSTVRSRWAPYH